jgi:methylenetetrahydrofolate dehydrogenase (NADP+) / methenyltetrahydrofolate cyclohydrolase
MQLIDGKELARGIRRGVKQTSREFFDEVGRAPVLSVVLVGEDPASQIYVENKKRACRRTEIESREHLLPASVESGELLSLIDRLNRDDEVDAILVQLPLPEQIDENEVIEAIDPAKDADGFHPVNLGRLLAGVDGAVPCTPTGCLRMIEHTGVDPAGKRAVVVGRSLIVGKPMAQLLLGADATVTVCHSRTAELAAEVSRAEIVIAAAGSPELIRGDWIREGAVVIDVGTNRREDGSWVGDVEFEAASRRAAWISPVPGGVGPMTIAMLMENTVAAARRRAGITARTSASG